MAIEAMDAETMGTLDLSRVAAHLGVAESDLQAVVEIDGQVIAVLVDFRKFRLPVADLGDATAAESSVATTADNASAAEAPVPAKAQVKKVRLAPGSGA